MKKLAKHHITVTLLLLTLLLGLREGQMTLWRLNDPQPLHIFPFRAAIFPERIRIALTNGIRIEEESDVGRLLLDMID